MPTHQLVFGCGETPARECSEDDDPLVFLAREGFGAYELNLGEQLVSDDLKPQATRMGMLPVLRCCARNGGEGENCLEQAKKLGAAAVSMRVGDPDATEEDSERLVQTVLENFSKARINLRFEIHPSSAVSGLESAARWCRKFPEVTLAVDAKQLVKEFDEAGDGTPLIESAAFTSLVPKTVMLRSDISNTSSSADGAAMEVVSGVWRAVMSHWRRHAPAGKWLLFVSDVDPSQHQSVDPKATWSRLKNYQGAAMSCWETALNASALPANGPTPS